MLMKLQMMSRAAFLLFKSHAKGGHIKHLNHRHHGERGVDLHFIRRVCARRIGQALVSLDFEFSQVTDDHFALAKLPLNLLSLNLNGCREISERTLVQISEQCQALESI